MADLFPPIIESKLPAQAGSTLKFQMQHNPSVGRDTALVAKISNSSSGTLIVDEIVAAYENGFVTIALSAKALESIAVQQFYKIQLAYQGSKYYSNVGVFKYTSYPNEEEIKNNNNSVNFTWEYVNGDETEPLYSYRFDIISDNEIVYTSGDVLSASAQTICEYECKELRTRLGALTYKVRCNYKTLNGLQGYVEDANLRDLEKSQEDASLLSEEAVYILPDSGCNYIEYSCSSNKHFLGRRNDITNEIKILQEDRNVYKDYTLEAGIPYSYIVYSPAERKHKIITTSAMNNFEDIFLSDTQHQLCIKFNPKIGSFKETVLETKTDTIGGPYPFFFRNGNVKYKEFSINGLISYHMDNEQLFSQNTPWKNNGEIIRNETPANDNNNAFLPTTNLTGENTAAERNFKMEVLQWLNNGQPKLFRSPTEGSFIVRLMNISLTPEESLSRMLHSFQATAYEIAECTQENLEKYNCLFRG